MKQGRVEGKAVGIEAVQVMFGIIICGAANIIEVQWIDSRTKKHVLQG